MNVRTVASIQQALLSLISRFPGVSESNLVARFPVLMPSEVRDFLRLLEWDGKISSRLVPLHRPTLFSDPYEESSATESARLFFPSLSVL